MLRRERNAYRWPSKVRGAMLALPTRSSGERIIHSLEWERTQTPGRERHAHRGPSMVRGAVLALPTMLRRERHAHRWPSIVRGAMLARPTRRTSYDGALGSGELILRNERELKRSEGSVMLIGDPLVRGAMLALPTRSSGERRTNFSEWEGTQMPGRERHAHRWPSKVRGAMPARPTGSAPSLDLVSTSEVITAIADSL